MRDYFLRDGGKLKKFGLRYRVRSVPPEFTDEKNLKSNNQSIN